MEGELQNCLSGLNTLADELRFAITAIAANDLSGFEQSIGRQAIYGEQLEAVLLRCKGLTPSNMAAQRLWGTRLRNAAVEVSALNEQYAALMEHSGNTLRMFRALYGQKEQKATERSRAWQG